jgi:hypothetical protein
MIQLFGSVFGQAASTSKRGASVAKIGELRATHAARLAKAVIRRIAILPKFRCADASPALAQVNNAGQAREIDRFARDAYLKAIL